MKRFLLLLFVVCLMPVASCRMSADSPKNAQSGSENVSTIPQAVELTSDNEHVIKVFEGEYSEEKYKKAYKGAIESYQYYCEPIEVDCGQSVVFTVGNNVERASVGLSSVFGNDIEKEVNNVIDLAVPVTVTNQTVAVYTGWWYPDEDEDDMWGFRVMTQDKDENVQWYYFRVKYNKNPNQGTGTPLQVPDDFDYSTWKIRINDKIYCATEDYGEFDPTIMSSQIGHIMGSCKEGETPTLNGFTNFGSVGSSYHWGKDGRVQIFTPDYCERWFELCE